MCRFLTVLLVLVQAGCNQDSEQWIEEYSALYSESKTLRKQSLDILRRELDALGPESPRFASLAKEAYIRDLNPRAFVALQR